MLATQQLVDRATAGVKRSLDARDAGARSPASFSPTPMVASPARWQDAERDLANAAEALTRLSEARSDECGDAALLHDRPAKRVRFACGPLCTADGHPEHEGETATRRRNAPITQASYTEPVTKHSIKVLEAELGTAVNGPSICRLKRRFGLAPPMQRHLPYVSPANQKKQPPPSHGGGRPQPPLPIFGRVALPSARRNPQQQQQQPQSMRAKATPEGQQRSASRLLDLLQPLEGCVAI